MNRIVTTPLYILCKISSSGISCLSAESNLENARQNMLTLARNFILDEVGKNNFVESWKVESVEFPSYPNFRMIALSDTEDACVVRKYSKNTVLKKYYFSTAAEEEITSEDVFTLRVLPLQEQLTLAICDEQNYFVEEEQEIPEPPPQPKREKDLFRLTMGSLKGARPEYQPNQYFAQLMEELPKYKDE